MELGRDPQTTSRPACRQCRARRVKCDRVDICCGPCSRLDLDCSYSGHSAEVGNQAGAGNSWGQPITPSPEYTQAGTKRRRIKSACEPCRAVKAKCSGGTICTRCKTRDIQCVQRSDSNLPLPDNSAPLDQGQGNAASLPTPSTAPGPISGLLISQRLNDSERLLIQAYFDQTDPTTCIFLHAPTVLRDWSTGKLDPWLSKAICASAFRLQESQQSSESLAATWITEVQEAVCSRLDSLSFPRLQALVLVIIYELEAGKTVKAWNLLGLAARIAFTLRLNHERPELAPTVQESRRRTMWTIYTYDRRLCGGLEDLTVCPISRMDNIRLPCEDRTFKRGMPSRAHFLNRDDTEGSSHDEMDIVSYLLRLYAIRDQILGYTKGVRRQDVSPAESRDQLFALEEKLSAFKSSLSPDLFLTDERLAIMAHSQDASGYFMLHSIWLQAYLDLYRFLVPGIREAATKEAIEATPTEYIHYCQGQCLERASQMIDMWHRVSQLRMKGSIDDTFFGVCIYQVSQILYCLPHLLNDTPDGIEGLKAKLSKALELGSPSLYSRFTRMGDCLREAERLVSRLGQPREASPAQATRRSSRDHHHMPSRGSLIPRESAESDDQEDATPPTQGDTRTADPSMNETSGVGVEPDDDHHQRFTPPVFDSSTLTFDGLRDGFMPWDPFDMQVNDYYDPELGALGFQY